MAIGTPFPLVSRDARAKALAQSLGSLACTAIVAPAGYGKTTLYRLACDRVAMPAVRYTIERWHGSDFAGPLVTAIRTERSEFGHRTLALASRQPRTAQAVDAWSRELGSTFARELDHVREPLLVAVDDVHELAGDPVFAGFLEGALHALPPHVHLALLGRALPRLPLPQWIAAGRARVLTVDDVRLDDDEVRALAAKLGRDVPAPQFEQLTSLYEGWAAGIALAFAAGDAAIPFASGSLDARKAYLVEANLSALEPGLVTFLEETSVFETLDVALLERDAAFASARGHVNALEQRGIMLEVVRPGDVYRVHPLLREALTDRVRARGPGALRETHARAGRILESAGRTSEALFQFEATGDDAHLARFIGTHAYDSFIAGHGERIARIAKRLERAGVAEPATVALIDGMIARQRGEPGAEAAFLRGLAAAPASDPIGVACRMSLVEDRLARRESVGEEHLTELRAVARAGGPFVELNVHVFEGWARAIAGDFDRARSHARRARSIAGDDPVANSRAASLEAYALTALGEFAQADALMTAMLRTLEASEHVVLFANTLVWYARFALLWGDDAAARDYAERGHALARELDLPAELAGIEIALAQLYARAGDRHRCERAGKAAVADSESAWYAGDRERTQTLAALFAARAAFGASDRSAALASARSAVGQAAGSDAGCAAVNAALATDLALYAMLDDADDTNALIARARATIAAASASDALDAALLGDASSLLAALGRSRGDETPTRLGHAVRETFGAFLAARAARLSLDESVDPLVRAVQPPGKPKAPTRAEAARGAELTPREHEILSLIAEGLTNREIAQRFTLSPRTVETHVERVLAKLGANSRTRAVATAMRTGLIAKT